MNLGIRAEVKVDADGTCPVAQAAAGADCSVDSVSRSVNPTEPNRVTEEFIVEAEDPEADVELTKIFDYGDSQVYRFTREMGRGCPCECIEAFDVPLSDINTRDGMLYLVFHADGMESLQNVIGALQDRYPTVDVQRLLRSEHDRPGHDLIFLDRGDLTERQREVLKTAHRMGYFEHPKAANAGEVAAELDISRSTFAEHLAAAQSKLLNVILDE